jgi:hypothetical protein
MYTILGFAVWFIGGVSVVVIHNRRLGKHPLAFKSFSFPKFDLKEWCMLALVAAVAIYLLANGDRISK